MPTIEDKTSIGDKYFSLHKVLNERTRRLWAATEARTLGFGGISLVADQTGLARSTIYRGLDELKQIEADHYADIAGLDRLRRLGAGRKSIIEVYPGISETLESLIEPVRGDPESPLRWTCKSTRRLAEELTMQGYSVSPRKVAALLYEMEYSLQANRKTREGINHPDRNEQFEYIYQNIKKFHRSAQPLYRSIPRKRNF